MSRPRCSAVSRSIAAHRAVAQIDEALAAGRPELRRRQPEQMVVAVLLGDLDVGQALPLAERAARRDRDRSRSSPHLGAGPARDARRSCARAAGSTNTRPRPWAGASPGAGTAPRCSRRNPCRTGRSSGASGLGTGACRTHHQRVTAPVIPWLPSAIAATFHSGSKCQIAPTAPAGRPISAFCCTAPNVSPV